MNRSMRLTVVICVSFAVLAPPVVWACIGSPQPPKCSQTAWVAKFVPCVVVNNNDTAETVIPINVIPYVVWDAGTPACAQPISASLEIRLECEPIGGGGVTQLQTVTISVDTPTSPGAQPVNGSVGGAVNYTIPQGTLGAGNFICTVVANFEVSFGTGRGQGVLTGTGDTQVCIVEPSPADPTIPRLNFKRLDPGDGGFLQCKAGDQGFNFYLLCNNDPNTAVTLDFTTSNTQIAVLPAHSEQDLEMPGFDLTTQTIFAPADELDPFFQSFLSDLPTDQVIPDSDPHATGVGELEQTGITLEPYDCQIITVATRSSGMCANGSCVETVNRIEGIWDDGSNTPALACCGTVAFIDDTMPAKTPLCEIADTICVDTNSFISAQQATVNGQGFLSTHANGNDVSNTTFPRRTNVSGMTAIEAFVGGQPLVADHPQMSTDTLRMHGAPEIIAYHQGVGTLVGGDPFQQQQFQQQVQIFNLPAGPFDILMPTIFPQFDGMNPDTQFGTHLIDYDATTGQLTINDIDTPTGPPIVQGPLQALIKNPPAGFTVNTETYRRFTKTPPPEGGIFRTDPIAVFRRINVNAPADPTMANGFLSGNPSAWSLSSPLGATAISLESDSGLEDNPIVVNIDPLQVSLAPEVDIHFVNLEGPNSLNVYPFPVVLRGVEGEAPPGIPAGDDCWSTSGCGGQTFIDFSQNPIPADFFDPGSDPFTGRIELGGQPLNGSTLGTTDTIVRRLGELDVPLAGSESTVDIQIVELNLVSCQPITVNVNGQDTEWDVRVELSSQATQPMGTLTATRTFNGGGTFDSVLPVTPEIHFTNTSSNQTITYTGLEKGAIGFSLIATDVPWLDGCSDPGVFAPGSPVSLPSGGMLQPSSGFFPSSILIDPGTGDECVCLQSLFQDTSGLTTSVVPARNTAGPDDDNDGVDDNCDSCLGVFNPFQEDTDLDGIGNDCDNCPTEVNTDQADRNTDGEGDACDDEDGDLLSDADEFECGTDPDVFDTDGDGFSDGFEKENGSDPLAGTDEPDFTPGDLDGSGEGNAADLQAVINKVLGLVVQFDTDVNDDSSLDSSDIQLYINFLLQLVTL